MPWSLHQERRAGHAAPAAGPDSRAQEVDGRQVPRWAAVAWPMGEQPSGCRDDPARPRGGKGGLGQKYKDNIVAIRIIKAMEAEGRVASFDERKQIAKYVGWGAIKGVFDPQNKQWIKQHAELKELLTDAEFKAARKSVLDAHYTGPIVVSAMYDAMQQLGFTGGRVLESSFGVGNFFGLMPSGMRNTSQLHGV